MLAEGKKKTTPQHDYLNTLHQFLQKNQQGIVHGLQDLAQDLIQTTRSNLDMDALSKKFEEIDTQQKKQQYFEQKIKEIEEARAVSSTAQSIDVHGEELNFDKIRMQSKMRKLDGERVALEKEKTRSETEYATAQTRHEEVSAAYVTISRECKKQEAELEHNEALLGRIKEENPVAAWRKERTELTQELRALHKARQKAFIELKNSPLIKGLITPAALEQAWNEHISQQNKKAEQISFNKHLERWGYSSRFSSDGTLLRMVLHGQKSRHANLAALRLDPNSGPPQFKDLFAPTKEQIGTGKYIKSDDELPAKGIIYSIDPVTGEQTHLFPMLPRRSAIREEEIRSQGRV